jgi:tripartite-type tricarboxylate transporter receptor subunit TctC
MGPAKLPDAVAARLKKALNESLQSPDFRKKMESASSTVAATGIDVHKFLTEETAKYKKIVDFAGTKE